MRNENIQCVWKGVEPTDKEIKQILEDHKFWLDSFGETVPPHDLRGSKLNKTDLSWAKLTNADLSESDLSSAKLDWAKLENAKLIGAKLENANLTGAHLDGAKLNEADLSGANLNWANLNEANLSGAKLNFSTMIEANLNGTQLVEAQMIGTIMAGAQMIEAKLNGAYLVYANLSATNLYAADFSDANVADVKYTVLKSCRGIRADTCYGSPRFRRHVMDMDYIEELRKSKWGWLYWPWLLTSNCGRSFSLWVLWAAFFAFWFALSFTELGKDSFHLNQGLDFSFLTMLYYSVVTFTTLGFGDVTPVTTEAQMWVMAEVILGYIMLGGLISIFANKFARRSG